MSTETNYPFPLLQLDHLLKTNGYRFVDFGCYEHDDIFPYCFKVCYDDGFKISLINENSNIIFTSQIIKYNVDTFNYIDELRKFIKVFNELKNKTYIDNSLKQQILDTFKEIY